MNKQLIQLKLAVLLVFISIASGCKESDRNPGTNEPPLRISLQLITDQVQSPLALGVPRDGSNRLFICQKEGKVWIIKNGAMLTQPFLDVSNQLVPLNPGSDERGLLGIAFHPDFQANHKFYVFYSVPSSVSGSNHKGILVEYMSSAGNPDVADISTKRVLLEVEEPEANHNGGNLAFGPEGYLYLALGDGGGGGDEHGTFGNGQNLETLLGKIIRIDVNGQPYTVPADNPFVNRADALPEIWTYGLRNPWRFSFDRVTNELFAGDVGQSRYEEVDIITKGGNYGWRVREGLHEFNLQNSPPGSNFTDPIYEYGHDQGISITGGYVYRGAVITELQGKYVYGDYNGRTWVLTKTGNQWLNSDLVISNKPANMQIYSWGEDEAGELYLLVNFPGGGNGAVYKVVK